MGLSTKSFTPSADCQKQIREKLGSKLVDSGEFRGDFWIKVNEEDLHDTVQYLRDNEHLSFDAFVDLCGVDYLGRQSPRFEVVTHLFSNRHQHRIRIRCLVPESSMTVPTLTDFWKAADWQEREAYDNYGIRFQGHPNLERILNAPNMKDHPQRKDFPLRGSRQDPDEL